ncbi:MAG: heat-inducible transcriptional repressor HrcA [Lachnospiraceae bacterium]|nr:heat-inducible transcriptional repressor HrcA [Lachnospiraceae bacterium]MEE3460472.1 heat-inducible transcriptional repressor HrcA [Lachnospiraceae bacterium]
MEDKLDDRKLKILKAIIRTYLDTGEPVGSRTISKYAGLNISSATIRNEMSDLEDMEYIIQPHTSAGRIPTDKAYRLYVDTMMVERDSEYKDLKAKLEEKAGKLDTLLKQAADLLASTTNYTTIVSAPRVVTKKVKFIQLTKVDNDHLLTIVVLDGNIIRNNIIVLDEEISDEDIAKLNFVMNTALNGLSADEMNINVIQAVKAQSKGMSTIVDAVLDIIASVLQDNGDPEVYTSGTTNMLKYPELADKEKFTSLLDTIEQNKLVTEWREEIPSDDEESHGIQVYIGDETRLDSMKDCSMVTATYRIHEGVYGRVGIVGPKRMDYDKVVSALKSMMSELDDIFKEKGE